MKLEAMASSIGVTINPAVPGTVVAFLPNGVYRRVSSWPELLELLTDHSAELVIDPRDAERIVRILNGSS